jgi:hypothetical protein
VAGVAVVWASAQLGQCASEPKPVAYDWGSIEVRDTMELFMKGRRVGSYTHGVAFDSISGTTTVVTSMVVEARSVGGARAVPAMTMVEERLFDNRGDLIEADQRLVSQTGKSTWKLRRKKSGSWELETVAGGVSRKSAVPGVVDNLRSTYDMHSAIEDGTVKKGQKWIDTLYDLTSAKPMIVVTECVAAPEGTDDGVWVFVNRDDLLGLEERWETDGLGQTLYQEVGGIFVAKRSGTSVGDDNDEDGALTLADITELFKVPAGKRPGKEAVVCLGLADSARLQDAVVSFYTESDCGYLLDRVNGTCGGHGSRSAIDSAWLAPTSTMQSDHPKIGKLAEKLRGSATDPCEIAGRFTRHVHSSIGKRNVATFPSALETLESGYGDCGEHAVLLAALLRAAGVPARVVLGLVYVPDKQGYLYHAWVMVHDGGQWLFADSAYLGRFPAVEGLIPLAVDDTGRNMAELVKLIGRVEIQYR